MEIVEASACAEYEIAGPPADGISAVRFSKNVNTWNWLMVSSWDRFLRLYDVSTNVLIQKFESTHPILDCAFSMDATFAYAGGLDMQVKMYDLQARKEMLVGKHLAGVSCIEVSSTTGIVASGSWDQTVKLWDQRQSNPLAHTLQQPGKVFALSVEGYNMVVGTAGRTFHVYDLRNPTTPTYSKESPLKYQTRSLRIFPNGLGFAIGSIEGRVALEYFDRSPEGQKKNYGFKCHRQKIEDQTLVFPVNCIAFHPKYETFATGGCDGVINMWDGDNKKRICQFRKYPTSIASMDFNHDGSYIALAVSYTFEEGIKDHPSDSIIIRQIQDSEAQRKQQAAP